jgi:hypothetical protein
LVHSAKTIVGENKIDVSTLGAGIYIVACGNKKIKLMIDGEK